MTCGRFAEDHAHINIGRISLYILFFPISLPSSPFNLFTFSISASRFIWDTVRLPPNLLHGTCLFSCALHTLSST